ncbi:hypothetical protein LJC34_00950 [Oscillospiraceae bacterium OttesenSCG-928-G22]|nr:hypothetical protein [Oscillospiraceae bacterium OttesenSCG-928-G22]
MKTKRITIFSGHYGSGKTSLALNYAFELKSAGYPVLVLDLDIVNPYFRTSDAAAALADAGIEFISSDFAGSNIDVPSIPPAARRMLDEKDVHAVVDVGGDDRGALALGRYASDIRRDGSYDMFLVVNRFRPLTSDGKGAVEVAREIERASGLSFTGIINNSNLGAETELETVLSSRRYAEEISEAMGLPLVRTTVLESAYPLAKERIEDVYPVKLFPKPEWRV